MNKLDYTIGDEIVSLKNHRQGAFKKNQVFIAKGLMTRSCGCLVVDIGIQSSFTHSVCLECNIIYGPNPIWYFNAFSFRKLDTLVDISELTEVLEKPIFTI
jgi:hypothetical protein